MKTWNIAYGLCLCAGYLLCLWLVNSESALVGAVVLSSSLVVPAVLDITDVEGKSVSFFFRGNNRRITYLCEVLLLVGFYEHHRLRSAMVGVLCVVPPTLVCHLASYNIYDYLDRLKLPYLVAKHRHRYVERIKTVPKLRSHVGRYYWTSELLMCVPAYLHTLARPLGSLWVWPALAVCVPVGLLIFDCYVCARINTRVRSRVYQTQLRHALFELQPEIVLHFGAKAASFYQVTMWLDAVKKLRRNVLLVLRNADAVGRAKKCGLPTLLVQTEGDVEYLIPSTVRLALFTGNTGNNLVFIRLPHLRSAFLGHGDSDKAASSNHATKVFDYVLVAGQAAIERYKRAKVRLKDSAFKIVGRPPLDVIARCAEPRDVERPRVLYAPTWEGWSESANYSSLSYAREQLSALLERFPEATIIFRPHPFTGLHLKQYSAHQKAIVDLLQAHSARHQICIGQEHSIYDCFNRSDVLVTDVSSVVSDYLASLKPIVLGKPPSMPTDAFVAQFAVAEACYLNNGERDCMVEQLATLLGGDPMREVRHRFAQRVLGALTISHTELFRDEMRAVLRRARKDFPVVLAEDEEKWNARFVACNRKTMLKKRRNDGRRSNEGELWIRAPLGGFCRDYFRAGDSVIIQSAKRRSSLSSGDILRLRSAEFDRKTQCYRLKLDIEPPPVLKRDKVKFQVLRDGSLVFGRRKRPAVSAAPVEALSVDPAASSAPLGSPSGSSA